MSRACVTVGLLVAAWGAPALAAASEGLGIVDASVIVRDDAGRAYFDLWFSGPLMLDGQPTDGLAARMGDAASPAYLAGDSFQVFIDADGSPDDGPGLPWETIVRGGEVPVFGGVPFRAAQGAADAADFTGGGWGPVIGVADVVVDGGHVSFNAPVAWLGEGLSPATLRYEVISTRDGVTVDRFVPSPTALTAGAALLGGLLVRRRRQSRR